MARIESQALAGYYALPTDQIAPIAGLIDVSRVRGAGSQIAVLDPCAADGAALLGLLRTWFDTNKYNRIQEPTITAYTAELELERATALQHAVNVGISWQAEQNALHCDAFCVEWTTGPQHTGVSLGYINAPYDHDAEHARLEQRFLERFTGALMPGFGILLFVLPNDALSASAAYLAMHYEDLHCFRFPDAHFASYRQVVLVARRLVTPFDRPDLRVELQVQRWAQDASSIPVLPEQPQPVLTLQAGRGPGLKSWRPAPLDMRRVCSAIRPGAHSDGRGMRLLGLDGSMDDLMGGRPFPVAMPPRPGHIAQALSAGILNGAVLQPDSVGLPHVLAKGVFERELATEKHSTNKKGETTSIVQVQQPSLQLCVLDIAGGVYHDIAPGSVPTGTTDLAKMNAADLLSAYRGSLVDVISQQCPALHPLGDPNAALPLAPLARMPYRAQFEAIYATLKLLGQQENPFIIGEVGTGKSTIALATIAALASGHVEQVRGKLAALGLDNTLRPVRRALIVCPPHLLQSWQDQIAAVLPGAGVVVLDSTLDVHIDQPVLLPSLPGAGLTFYILSRETAKLGHGLSVGVDSRRRCPRCGAPQHEPDKELLGKRMRCQGYIRQSSNAASQISTMLARLLITALPTDMRVTSRVEPRLQALARKREQARDGLDLDARVADSAAAWSARSQAEQPLALTPLGRQIGAWAAHLREEWASEESSAETLADKVELLGWLFFAAEHADRDGLLRQTIIDLYTMAAADRNEHGRGYKVRGVLRKLALLIVDGAVRSETIAALREHGLDVPHYSYSYQSNPWEAIERAHIRLAAEAERAAVVADGLMPEAVALAQMAKLTYGDMDVRILPSGRQSWDERVAGVAAAKVALDRIAAFAQSTSIRCGEPLFQATPAPRRFSVARYISRKARGRFDLLVLDEGHEFAGDGSAQEIAIHRLTEMGLPTLLLTGSLMNGYASGLFRNLWALSRRFRSEFGRDDQRAFVTRYGYRRVLREPKSDSAREALSYGAVTDRRELDKLTTMRTIGEAPGVLPVLLLQHLLPIAVTIRKSDLDDAIPPCEPPEIVPIICKKAIPSDVELARQADMLFQRTIAQIKADRFKSLSGKLFGALGQLPSFYDRATTDAGNKILPDGSRAWEVAYPEEVGGALVARATLLDASVRLPKERWLVQQVRAELAEGRNVLIFVSNSGKTGIAPRLARILAEETGETPIILEASKVPTAKRETWINQQVIAAGRRVMIVNPVTVQTGLNNLVWFNTAIWYQNPQCNAIVFRQANGRLDRIGQTKKVRIFVPVYADTPQDIAQLLLARKILASEQVDGGDVAASLDAAGAGGDRDALDTLEMGRAIYAMLTGEQA